MIEKISSFLLKLFLWIFFTVLSYIILDEGSIYVFIAFGVIYFIALICHD